MKNTTVMAAAVALGLALAGCSGGSDEGQGGRPGGGRPGAGGPGGRPGGGEAAAVPVEVAAVTREAVASYIQTNGALEAENDVEILARTQGPIVELLTEEGRRVSKGQVMARIDPKEAQAQVQIAEVTLREAERAFKRAQETYEEQLISQAEYDAALAAKEGAEATLVDRQVQLSYTDIRAPFSAVVVDRAIKLGDTVAPNQILFRVSDFDPLLCKIQVPEKELPKLHKGQPAYLTVEAWPGERFEASVLRLSPVVDSTTGTIRVTLQVQGQNKLRPGMFASVFLETDRHDDAMTIPKSALSLESLGDTVYIVNGDVAARRAVQLGYEEADIVEVTSGLEETDHVIVVGQDGLSDGTPIRILGGPGAEKAPPRRAAEGAPSGEGPGAEMTRAASGGGRRTPPAEMVSACKDKDEGDDCAFTAPWNGADTEGSCRPRRDDASQLVCRPSGGFGGGRPGSGGGL